MRPASKQLLRGAVRLVEAWAGREVFVEEFSREYLLAFRAWRLEARPLPLCPLHGDPMIKSNGLRARCHLRGCGQSAVYVPQVGPPTANKDVRHLRSIWAEASDQGFNSQPLKRLKPLPEELDNLPCHSPEEIAAILAACALENDLFLSHPARFWTALTLTVYDCGPRISVIMKTTPADLDVVEGTITLRAGDQKQRKCQVIQLSPQTLEALKAIHDPQAAWLFPWPYDRTQTSWPALTKRLKRILARAGLPAGAKDLWHKFRRTTATYITIELGIEAAREHLGHSHVKVTDRYIDKRKLPKSKANSRVLPRPDLPLAG